MTHNKYFFSGGLESVRKDPEGGNQPQEFVPEGVASGPHASDVLPVSEAADTHGAHSFNLNAMLLEAIRLSDYFWDLAKYKTFHEVVDQIYYNCTYATPWVPGTHKSARTTGMQSAVRGVRPRPRTAARAAARRRLRMRAPSAWRRVPRRRAGDAKRYRIIRHVSESLNPPATHPMR